MQLGPAVCVVEAGQYTIGTSNLCGAAPALGVAGMSEVSCTQGHSHLRCVCARCDDKAGVTMEGCAQSHTHTLILSQKSNTRHVGFGSQHAGHHSALTLAFGA